jgi:hypothetical protein
MTAIGSAAVPVPVITLAPAMSPDEALQVLALAQRTAENHITAANRHAETVRAEAQAAAEQIRREAHAYADRIRDEVDNLLNEARSAADLRAQDAEAQAAEVRRRAEATLADAHTEAERIVADGRDRAEQLDLRAKQRYEDAVGSLAVKREALQKQIELLAAFDADYRQRLAEFMHAQLRSLWIESSGAHAALELSGGPIESALLG